MPKRVQATRDCRPQNEELRELFSRAITTVRWVGHVARKGEQRYSRSVLVGRPEGQEPLEEMR